MILCVTGRSVELALIFAFLDEIFFNDGMFVIASTLTLSPLSLLLYFGLEGFDKWRIKLFIEAELPLNERDLRIHSLLLVWRWEERIKCDSEPTIYHVCDNFLQYVAGSLQARIGIDLYEIDLEIIVQHEVEAVNLKRVVLELAARCYDRVRGTERISHDLLNLAEDVQVKVDFEVSEILVQVVLILAKAQLIALLVPAVIVRLLLHCIVRQVDQLVRQVIVDERLR